MRCYLLEYVFPGPFGGVSILLVCFEYPYFIGVWTQGQHGLVLVPRVVTDAGGHGAAHGEKRRRGRTRGRDDGIYSS
jgi:hypothetical protein